MKRILLSLLLLASINVFAQSEAVTNEDLENRLQSLKTDIQVLQNQNRKLKSEINYFKNQLSIVNNNIDSLRIVSQVNRSVISKTANELTDKISATETNVNQKIFKVDKSLSKKSLYGIIGVLTAFILSGLFYYVIRKRQNKDKIEVVEQLNLTKTSIEENLVKEFSKQTDLIESQLEFMVKLNKERPISENVEPDHSLALRVADQITTIERAISLMDEKTKGLQRIKNSITSLKDNLAANGYDIIEVIGKHFNQGMNIIVASSIPDENMKKGEEIITRVIKPQVNFNNKMIQAAQVEVSVGI